MGQGYTRNDTSNNIADGNVINASDLDGEFDAVDAAFNESSGHTHDGTADEGAPVTVLGPVQDFVASATEIKPKTTNTLDIGTTSLQFKDMYLDGTAYIDGLGEDILVATNKKIQFRDTALFINSSADGQLDIAADTEVEITTPLVEISADATVGDDLTLKSDAAVLGFGADTDVTLTHVADTGLLLNAAMVVQFRDSAINIGSPADGDLDINADDEIELNSTLIDINGAVDISGATTVGGVLDVTDATDASDATGDTGALRTEGGASIAKKLYVGTDLDVDGTANLDVVDIDGAVDMASTLQVDGAITSSTGATITTADNTSQLTLKSTDADATVGPVLTLNRDSGSPADGDNLGQIQWLGDNDAGQSLELHSKFVKLRDASDGAEDAQVFHYAFVGGSQLDFLRYGTGSAGGGAEFVINESSADIDFRIESNADANAFFLEGSTGNVGIGTASPTKKVSASIGLNDTDGFVAEYSGDAKGGLLIVPTTGEVRMGAINSSGTYFPTFYSNNSEAMRIDSIGQVGLLGSSNSFDTTGSVNGLQLYYESDVGIATIGSYSSGGNTSLSFHTNSGGSASTEAMRITSDGKVGIGTTSPSQLLSIVDTNARMELLSGSGGTSILDMGISGDADKGGIRYADGTGSLAFRANNDQRMIIGSTGNVGIGPITTPGFRLEVLGDDAAQYIAYFKNDGNNANRYGLLIAAGADSGAGTLIGFTDGDGTGVGSISFSGGTVTYAAFTANHLCIIPDADNDPDSDLPAYPYGTLLETTSLSYSKKSDGTDSERGIIYNVRKTQTANSKAVLGAYGGCLNGGPDNQTNEHQVLILGDGHILCNNAGGNIEIGDGICSSATAGIGQKATATPSMIIGIAQEDVTFSSDSETKLVAVQYGLQQFTPWS